MKRQPDSHHIPDQHARRGAVLVLVAAMLIVLVIVSGFMIDLAYMQLVRTELRAATDAASKAAVEALTREEDVNAAIAAAIANAAKNNVAGNPLTITSADVEVGNSSQNANGVWNFNANAQPENAVRVTAQMLDGSTTGSVPLFFGNYFGSGTFQPTQQATASHLDQDIVLCVDRSHSMCFDESGISWSYPWLIEWYVNNIWYIYDAIQLAPDSNDSRWASLDSAINLFLDELDTRTVKPKCALVTWGSEIGTNTYEYQMTGKTAPETSQDVNFTTSYQNIRTSIDNRGSDVMLGGTNMAAGMDDAIDMLTGSNVRRYSQKMMILMTDGQWNQGRDPILAAQDAAAANIKIYTVTFLSNTDQTTMEQIAAITGGDHYHASNRTELEEAFKKIAATLPIVLTE